MGNKSRVKKKFLEQHKYCCFCGGKNISEESDHVPARVFFEGRVWPEGFIFPACSKCNRETKDDEQIVALLSRIYPDSTNEKGRQETLKIIRAISNNYPNILEVMMPSVRQKRDYVKKNNLKLPPGTSYTDIPILNVNDPLIHNAMYSFGRKLFSALYYKHTNTALPSTAGIAIRWFSNIQIEDNLIPRSLKAILSNIGELKRAKTALDEQFYYRWCLSNSKNIAVFLAFFRESFAILGYINLTDDHNLDDDATIVYPYDWETQ